jgi:hypothetical protein
MPNPRPLIIQGRVLLVAGMQCIICSIKVNYLYICRVEKVVLSGHQYHCVGNSSKVSIHKIIHILTMVIVRTILYRQWTVCR